MCNVCRNNPCLPTCPNVVPELYCEQCNKKIRKGTTYFTDTDYFYTRLTAFCSADCLKQYFDIEEEEA